MLPVAAARGDGPSVMLSPVLLRRSRCWRLLSEDRLCCCWPGCRALVYTAEAPGDGAACAKPAPDIPLTARYLFHHESNLNAAVRPNDLQCVRWISNLANILLPLLGSPPRPPTLAKLRHIPRRVRSSTRIHKLGSRNQTTRCPMAVFPMAAKAPRSLTACKVAP